MEYMFGVFCNGSGVWIFIGNSELIIVDISEAVSVDPKEIVDEL